MLLRVTFAVVVVCVGGMWCDVNADAGRLVVPRDYGVKLCGREFIRAVIFTCGGSRWKRSLPEDADPFQRSYYSDTTEEDYQPSWQHGVELTPPLHTSSSYSLADLLALFGALGDTRRPESNQNPLGALQPSAVLGDRERAPTGDSANRRKRNFSLGVAGMCCNQGCTKNDIGRLC
ncbi:prorelaxin H1 [Polymixia lowei]